MDGNSVFDKIKNIDLKYVCYMVSQAWMQMRPLIIMNGWKHLFRSLEEIQDHLPSNNFNITDEILIATLYRIATPNNHLQKSEILSWAEGRFEHVRDIDITAEDIINKVRGVENNEVVCENDAVIEDVIDSMNKTIEWGENGKLDLHEILLLRRIREKAIKEKYKFQF